MDFRDQGLPALWGEVSPEGVVTWHPEFTIAEIGVEEVVVDEDLYVWTCGSHHRLVPGPA
jgi:hypothetical protein